MTDATTLRERVLKAYGSDVWREARPLLPGGIMIPGLYFIRIHVHDWRLIS